MKNNVFLIFAFIFLRSFCVFSQSTQPQNGSVEKVSKWKTIMKNFVFKMYEQEINEPLDKTTNERKGKVVIVPQLALDTITRKYDGLLEGIINRVEKTRNQHRRADYFLNHTWRVESDESYNLRGRLSTNLTSKIPLSDTTGMGEVVQSHTQGKTYISAERGSMEYDLINKHHKIADFIIERGALRDRMFDNILLKGGLMTSYSKVNNSDTLSLLNTVLDIDRKIFASKKTNKNITICLGFVWENKTKKKNELITQKKNDLMKEISVKFPRSKFHVLYLGYFHKSTTNKDPNSFEVDWERHVVFHKDLTDDCKKEIEKILNVKSDIVQKLSDNMNADTESLIKIFQQCIPDDLENEEDTELTDDDFKKYAELAGIKDWKMLKALTEVETEMKTTFVHKGKTYPRIAYERHIMYQCLNNKFKSLTEQVYTNSNKMTTEMPELVHPNPNMYYRGYNCSKSNFYKIMKFNGTSFVDYISCADSDKDKKWRDKYCYVEDAIVLENRYMISKNQISAECAFISTSFGLGQIMGFNILPLFDDLESAEKKSFSTNPKDQLDLMSRFIKSNKSLKNAINEKEWAEIVKNYNGAYNSEYVSKLESFYNKN